MTDQPRVLSERYRVDERIGRGGMASVYRGYDLTLGREVAIKLLRRDLAGDPAFRTRFRLEAQAASRMSNPAIVRVYDAGEEVERDAAGTTHPVPYIVMELVRGRLLKDIASEGPVSVDDAVRYVDGILEALEYSHRAGVVHRDIKPGNVMVADTPGGRGRVKVMDFGIARAVSDSSSTVAETTAIIGTAAYFSPEQAKGESVDARADLYSTGVVLYELLTGRTPFRGDSPVAVAYQHVSETPEAPSELNPDVPRSLDEVVLRALAKDPFQRFQDAASFREALDATHDGRVPSKRKVGALTNELYGPDPRQAAATARSLRQLGSEPAARRTQPGPPAAWIWGGVALIAVLLVAVLFWVVSLRTGANVPAGARIIPDVSQMTYQKAAAVLHGKDLVPYRVDEIDGAVEKGIVIRTDPAPGLSVSKGQQVQVFVSLGVAQVAVPTLTGLAQDAATAAITGAGLALGQITQRNDPTLAAGIVLSSSPATGAMADKGSTVDLVVASGRVVLINVTGFTLDAATRTLQAPDTQLTVQVQPDPTCKATNPQTVTQQSLPPGEAPVHSTITLTVCSGS